MARSKASRATALDHERFVEHESAGWNNQRDANGSLSPRSGKRLAQLRAQDTSGIRDRLSAFASLDYLDRVRIFEARSQERTNRSSWRCVRAEARDDGSLGL
ncbi:hypothetical protein KM043_018391 [Ampulex compressa]|nr:hypothetical protein KM043_018391 [Ampulex compressa]